MDEVIKLLRFVERFLVDQDSMAKIVYGGVSFQILIEEFTDDYVSVLTIKIDYFLHIIFSITLNNLGQLF